MGDAELDFLIGAVPLPEGMLESAADDGSLTDADIDGELAMSNCRAGCNGRVERAMRWQSQRARLIGWAVAASLLAIISGVAYWSGVGGQLAQQAVDPHTQNARSVPTILARSVPRIVKVHNKPANHDPTLADVKPLPEKPLPETTPARPWLRFPSADEFVHDHAPPASNTDRATVPADPSSALQPIFGGAPVQEPPNLKLVSAPLPRRRERSTGRGIRPSLRNPHGPASVRGSVAACRSARQPCADLDEHVELRIVVPVGRCGMLPPPSLVHTEDFLAAMDYGFPLPTSGPVGIGRRAGPAPWDRRA